MEIHSFLAVVVECIQLDLMMALLKRLRWFLKIAAEARVAKVRCKEVIKIANGGQHFTGLSEDGRL